MSFGIIDLTAWTLPLAVGDDKGCFREALEGFVLPFPQFSLSGIQRLTFWVERGSIGNKPDKKLIWWLPLWAVLCLSGSSPPQLTMQALWSLIKWEHEASWSLKIFWDFTCCLNLRYNWCNHLPRETGSREGKAVYIWRGQEDVPSGWEWRKTGWLPQVAGRAGKDPFFLAAQHWAPHS